MMQTEKFNAWVVLVLLTIPNLTSGQNEVAHGSVALPGAELREFHSEIMQQDFNIYVQLPLDYHPQRKEKYPVMYVTDGNRSFPMVANISTILGFPDTGFPQVVVVGIAYPIVSMADWAVWRTRDLTPTRNEETEKYWADLLFKLTGGDSHEIQTGGASRFLAFITEELIPFIESEYWVSAEDRALGGYSYGGLFTLYSLFEKPGWFGRYFAGSPSIRYDDEVLFRIEEEFAAANKELEGKLFLSAGELEGDYTVGSVNKMSQTLEARGYPRLEIYTQIFEDEDHQSAYPASVMRAFTLFYTDQTR
jgi:predicted alpha/beta superfamily hydrolase